MAVIYISMESLQNTCIWVTQSSSNSVSLILCSTSLTDEIEPLLSTHRTANHWNITNNKPSSSSAAVEQAAPPSCRVWIRLSWIHPPHRIIPNLHYIGLSSSSFSTAPNPTFLSLPQYTAAFIYSSIHLSMFHPSLWWRSSLFSIYAQPGHGTPRTDKCHRACAVCMVSIRDNGSWSRKRRRSSVVESRRRWGWDALLATETDQQIVQ